MISIGDAAEQGINIRRRLKPERQDHPAGRRRRSPARMNTGNHLLRIEQQPIATGQFDLDVRTVGFGDRQAEQTVEVQRTLQVARDVRDAAGRRQW